MKYYLALAGDKIRSLYTQDDLDYFSEQENNSNPFELFSGKLDEEQVTDIYVCNLTSKGLVYKKKLNRDLEEVDL